MCGAIAQPSLDSESRPCTVNVTEITGMSFLGMPLTIHLMYRLKFNSKLPENSNCDLFPQ
jgi:hypothetical protein